MSRSLPGGVVADVAAGTWRRLDVRMIWVDLAQSALALAPAVIAVWVVGVDPGAGGLWPLLGLAAVGVAGAAADALRWLVTRYRVTGDLVELRTGLLVRSHRSIRRDRIRSVDIEARLRHRLAALRVVRIGAGQQSAAGKSALALDAVRTADAHLLRRVLTRGEPGTRGPAGPGGPPAADEADAIRVFARFEPSWVVYNVFNVWAYVMALGLAWGAYWLLQGFGVDAGRIVADVVDGTGLGWAWTVVVAVLAVGAFGVVGMAVNYVVEYWNFELARVPGENGTVLRTRQGLLTTREVERDDTRMRGVQIAEPLLWRWLGVTDTTVVTTGLNMWSMAQPAAILPRAPVAVARRVAAEVLAARPDPFRAALTPHPGAALRRRLWWATATTAGVAVGLAWLATTDAIPGAGLWLVAGLWPLLLGAALVAYRALGHAICGDHLVVRSGLVSRATTALQRSAVSTVAIRRSPLQRRLGLSTVSLMTAAGYGAYDATDLDADDALSFADRAAPGLLSPFLVPGDRVTGTAPCEEGSKLLARSTSHDGNH